MKPVRAPLEAANTANAITVSAMNAPPFLVRLLPLLLAISTSLLAGCAAGDISSKTPAWTLQDNPRAPYKLLEKFFDPAKWGTVRKMKYDGYVELRGTVNEDHSVNIGHVYEAFPDDSRNELAMEFSKKVRMSPVKVGSHVRPGAKIYVYFYERGHSPHEALVVAEQDSPVATDSFGGTIYLTIFEY